MPLHGHDISHLPPPSDPVIETCYSLFTSAPVASVDFRRSLGHLPNRKGFQAWVDILPKNPNFSSF